MSSPLIGNHLSHVHSPYHTVWLQQHLVAIVHTLPPISKCFTVCFFCNPFPPPERDRDRERDARQKKAARLWIHSRCVILAFLMIAWMWQRRTCKSSNRSSSWKQENKTHLLLHFWFNIFFFSLVLENIYEYIYTPGLLLATSRTVVTR